VESERVTEEAAACGNGGAECGDGISADRSSSSGVVSDRVVDSADVLGGDCTVDALCNQPPLRCLLLRVELPHQARDRHQRLHLHFIVHRHLHRAAVGRMMAGLQALLHATTGADARHTAGGAGPMAQRKGVIPPCRGRRRA